MARKTQRMLPFRDEPGSEVVSLALNIGPKSSAWLRAAGVESIDQVRDVGPVAICRKLIEKGYPVSVLMAYALEGAISGVHWNSVSFETKESIRAEFSQMKRDVAKTARLKGTKSVQQ